jgi:hypothetical protein
VSGFVYLNPSVIDMRLLRGTRDEQGRHRSVVVISDRTAAAEKAMSTTPGPTIEAYKLPYCSIV